ncbi:hypothetical protein TrCOL_g5649 [Triparma columacea]|uniref:CN hydrolase domain-containing protein n=1 Tax=Triparma columacea TaxID=722753 RepID=A0A9W7GNG1_9STRA|nr:hypothetical protein TrCOL_g5649 [Triparma columacea]
MRTNPRRKSTFATLTEYCHSRIFPYGSYGILPYTQYGLLPVMQLASVGGVWLIEVFMSYVSATLALAYHEVDKKGGVGRVGVGRIKRVVITIALVLAYGGCRARWNTWEGADNAIKGGTVRVAGVWLKNTMVVREQLLRHHLGIVMDGKEGPEERDWEGEKWKEIQEWVLEDIEILREEVAKEASAGATIVMTPELSLVTFQGPGVPPSSPLSTPSVLSALAKIASDNNVHLGVGIGYNEPFVKVPNLSKFTETVLEKENGMMGVESNRFVLLSPNTVNTETYQPEVNGPQPHNNVALDYIKYNPVPIIEGPFAVLGNKTIPTATVPLSPVQPTRIGSCVCFDMEHPWHVHQLGLKTDLVLNPSYDWPGLNPYHARITAFRAVELGSSVFHHCQAGTTVGYDHLGNQLGHGDYFSPTTVGDGCKPLKPEIRCRPGGVVANLPIKGVSTIYAMVGEWVPIVCAAWTARVVWGKTRG